MATTDIQSTWFDHLPTEILYLIFDYLSNNDILYTFFFLNQRFKSLILQNQRYLTYLELPSTDLEIWKRILSVIDSQIECLNITTNDFFASLEYFPNLRSLIVSFPYGLSNEEWILLKEYSYHDPDFDPAEWISSDGFKDFNSIQFQN